MALVVNLPSAHHSLSNQVELEDDLVFHLSSKALFCFSFFSFCEIEILTPPLVRILLTGARLTGAAIDAGT